MMNDGHVDLSVLAVVGTGNNKHPAKSTGTSLVVQTIENMPAMWEIEVQPLGQEDPLEKGMAIHSSILAWRIPWTEQNSLEGYSPQGCKRVDMT